MSEVSYLRFCFIHETSTVKQTQGLGFHLFVLQLEAATVKKVMEIQKDLVCTAV